MIKKNIIKNMLYSNKLTKNVMLYRSYLINEKEKRQNIYNNCYLPLKKKLSEDKNSVLLLFTPEYPNLGDHVITLAEKKILDDLKIGYIEVTHSQVWKLSEINKINLFNGRNIIINGGGFLGTI